ncbi:MAG: cell division protein ZapB [Deltaproteobacteria bacterium]|nr:cell division protein ZapB [Deltaproteobacteria bacterium]
MKQEEEIDYFKVLEEKVDSLIRTIIQLKEEKESMILKNQNLMETRDKLTAEVEDLNRAKNEARGRVVSLLEKLEQMDI